MATIAEELAAFAARLDFDRIPAPVVHMAKHLILDAVGIAYASSTRDFARQTVESLGEFGTGEALVMGFPQRLALRDAVLANGILMHGLDFDDTHTIGFVHATSGCFATALGAADHRNKSCRDLVTAYVAGMEAAARIGAVARGEFQQIGFHPTGLVAAFACSLIAGKLFDLSEEQLVMAQGIVLSMAAGSREYTWDAAGTKRMHPGWAGVAGITAAVLARGGMTGPRTAYEGPFGLYTTHLHAAPAAIDMAPATRGLGAVWETLQVSVKPYPVGHFNVAFIDAAIAVSREHDIRVGDIAHVEVLVPAHAVKIVCEPVASRKRPASSYAAQFSSQFTVACGLMLRKFGLAELERYRDPELLALADKVNYRIDPDTGYPRHLSGEVIVTLKNGEQRRHREQINRGAPENPVSDAGIVEKFSANAAYALSPDRVDRVKGAILALDQPGRRAGQLIEALAV